MEGFPFRDNRFSMQDQREHQSKENMRTLTLQAVIFDCDGILVDTEPLHYRAFQEVLEPLGLGFDYEHYLRNYIGFDDRDAFLEAFREAGRSIDARGLASLVETKGKALFRILTGGISTFPGVVECVKGLAARGVPLAVASGAMREEVLAFIDALGLAGVFPVIVAADEVKRSKPDPESYLTALERLRRSPGLHELNPHYCVAIEDTPAGIQSAKGAGLNVVAVTNSFPRERLQDADAILEDLTGLGFSELDGIVRAAAANSR